LWQDNSSSSSGYTLRRDPMISEDLPIFIRHGAEATCSGPLVSRKLYEAQLQRGRFDTAFLLWFRFFLDAVSDMLCYRIVVSAVDATVAHVGKRVIAFSQLLYTTGFLFYGCSVHTSRSSFVFSTNPNKYPLP
jgi:hypothetical protein